MSVIDYLLSGSKLKKAKMLSTSAHLENGEKADQLFQEAFDNFSSVSSSRIGYPDALHGWGLALVNQAQKKTGDAAIKILEEAITKFNLCDAVKANHLGASLDGGVALMELAKAKNLNADDDLYIKAKESFLNAENIQQGSASYNLACLYALHNEGDNCLEALEKARDCGLVPDEQDILNDSDLANVKQLAWFGEFITSLVEEEPVKETKVAVEEAVASDADSSTNSD